MKRDPIYSNYRVIYLFYLFLQVSVFLTCERAVRISYREYLLGSLKNFFTIEFLTFLVVNFSDIICYLHSFSLPKPLFLLFHEAGVSTILYVI